MAQITFTNRLSATYPRREEVELRVRAAFREIRGGPWEVAIAGEKGGLGTVVVGVRLQGGACAFATIRYNMRLDEIYHRLKFFERSRFKNAETEAAEQALNAAIDEHRAIGQDPEQQTGTEP